MTQRVPPQAVPSVLIADADPYICRVFEAKLTKDNPFRTMSVTTGKEALQAASQNIFNVVLWDMRLRDSSRLLPHIRALCPQAALLLLTTDDRPTLESDLARLDVSGILVKPLNLDALVDRVRAAIDAPQSVSLTVPMDITRVGQRLELTSALGTCVTRVLENGHDSFTVVGAPRVDVPRDFRIGLRLRAQIVGDDAVYSFTTRLIGAVNEPIDGWQVQKPRAIRREQRRKYSRMPLTFAISLEPEGGIERPIGALSESAGAPVRVGMPVRGRTEDFGIGGCSLVSDIALPAGTPVCFVLTSSADGPITGSGTIVRTAPSTLFGKPSPDAVYRLALRFLSLSPTSRRRLRDMLDPTS